MKGEGTGDGAVDALLQAINAATGIAGVLKEYHVAAVTADTDALGEVSVLVEHEGRLVSGQSVSTDTLEASARAYLRALSNALAGSVREPSGRRRDGGSTAVEDFDFIWNDGERVIRFGVGALAEAPELLAAAGFENYALLTTERAEEQAEAVVQGAYLVAHVPDGPVPDAAAAVRERVNDRPLVALGGGRVIDAAKAIAGADGLRCAAIPTTLSGAEMTPFHRMPAEVDEFRLVRPALVLAAPGPDGLAADAGPGRQRDERARARRRGALHAALEPGRAHGGAAGRRADRRRPCRRGARPALARARWPAGRIREWLAGFAIHHAVCQTIVRLCGTPHAQTNAIMLPHFVRIMELRAREQIEQLGVALGADDRRGAAAEAVERLARRAEAGRLSYYGVDADALKEIVKAVSARPELQNTPNPPSEGELLGVLERAL